MLKKVLGWAAVAFIAFYILTHPAAAGHTTHNLIGGLRTAGNSLATFFSSI